MSLANLTSVSTETLSLLLERQRLQSLPSFSETGTLSTDSVSNETSLHFSQIKRNMAQLREGILELEAKEEQSEATRLLREQYDHMRGMLEVEKQSEIPSEFLTFPAPQATFSFNPTVPITSPVLMDPPSQNPRKSILPTFLDPAPNAGALILRLKFVKNGAASY